MLRIPHNSIVLNCSAGLGNRMLALGSAVALGQAIDKRVYLYWPVNGHLGCRFDHLFEKPERFTVINDSPTHARLLEVPYSRNRHKHHSGCVVNWMPKNPTPAEPTIPVCTRPSYPATWGSGGKWPMKPLRSWHANMWRFDAVLWPPWRVSHFDHAELDNLRNRRRIYIHYYRTFFPSPLSNLPIRDHFVPVRAVRDEVDRIAAKFNGTTIGIHIRRGDWIDRFPERLVSTALYVRRMEREIDRDDATRFYLATDSNEIADELKQRFGERIITSSNRWRETRQGIEVMRNALVDLEVLSKTSTIICPDYTTFAHAAALIGQIERQTVDGRRDLRLA